MVPLDAQRGRHSGLGGQGTWRSTSGGQNRDAKESLRTPPHQDQGVFGLQRDGIGHRQLESPVTPGSPLAIRAGWALEPGEIAPSPVRHPLETRGAERETE